MTPELKAKLLRYANECEPFTAHNHIEITDIGEGSSRVELHLTCESMNRWGQPHGGILFTLADDACGRRPASPSAPRWISWPLPGMPGILLPGER